MSLFPMSRAHNRIGFDELVNAADELERKKQHRHELWLLSCYLEPEVVRDLVAELDKRIRLTDVYLAFDVSEYYRIGPRAVRKAMGALKSSCTQRSPGVYFDWRVLAARAKGKGMGGLVHAKGFAVLQRVDDIVSGGVLLIGSANLTRPGLSEGRNIELGYISKRLGDLRAFESAYDQLWSDYSVDIDSTALELDDAQFRYALLSSGVFLHKWSGGLRQLVGIKYQVANKEKWAQLPPELKEEGFELSDTLTRQPLPLKDLPQREVSADFARSFTIDTAIGRWCPREVWQLVAEQDAEQFVQAFNAATDLEKLNAMLPELKQRQDELIARELIRPVDKDHLDRWLERISALRANPDRLRRIHTGYEDFYLPYDPKRVAEIADLFESLEDSLRMRSSDNWVAKKLKACISSRDLSGLEVDDDARQLLDSFS